MTKRSGGSSDPVKSQDIFERPIEDAWQLVLFRGDYGFPRERSSSTSPRRLLAPIAVTWRGSDTRLVARVLVLCRNETSRRLSHSVLRKSRHSACAHFARQQNVKTGLSPCSRTVRFHSPKLDRSPMGAWSNCFILQS